MHGAPGIQTNGNRADGAFNSVNQHCLESIVQLSEEEEVIAAEDIHDEHGHKLWAKGHPVSRSLQEKLLRRRLARPLEATLSVEGGATMKAIVDDCRSLMAGNKTLELIAGSSDARGLMRGVESLPLPGPLRLLLTSVRKHKQESYRHSLAAMLVSAGLASRLMLTEHDASHLILASLIHDIGEMYINPAYLDGSTRLAPEHWKHVALHPKVGEAFIREFTSFPTAVTQCVLHHHERLDGSGYPLQVERSRVGQLDSLLAVADSVAAIASRGGCDVHQRIAVALRIVPEEFDRAAVAAIGDLLRTAEGGSCAAPGESCVGRVTPVLKRLHAARNEAQALLCAEQSVSADAVRYVMSVLATIDKSLRATGLADVSQLGELDQDPEIAGEICLVVREVGWRLRNLARNAHLRVESRGQPQELARIARLVAALDEPPVEGAAA